MPQPSSTVLCPTITRHSNTMILMSFRNICAIGHWGQMSWCSYFHFPSLGEVKLCYAFFSGGGGALLSVELLDDWGFLYLEGASQSVSTNMHIINFNLILYRMHSQSLCYASPSGYASPSISDSWWQRGHLRATAKAQMSMRRFFIYTYIYINIYIYVKNLCAKSLNLRPKKNQNA